MTLSFLYLDVFESTGSSVLDKDLMNFMEIVLVFRKNGKMFSFH